MERAAEVCVAQVTRGNPDGSWELRLREVAGSGRRAAAAASPPPAPFAALCPTGGLLAWCPHVTYSVTLREEEPGGGARRVTVVAVSDARWSVPADTAMRRLLAEAWAELTAAGEDAGAERPAKRARPAAKRADLVVQGGGGGAWQWRADVGRRLSARLAHALDGLHLGAPDADWAGAQLPAWRLWGRAAVAAGLSAPALRARVAAALAAPDDFRLRTDEWALRRAEWRLSPAALPDEPVWAAAAKALTDVRAACASGGGGLRLADDAFDGGLLLLERGALVAYDVGGARLTAAQVASRSEWAVDATVWVTAEVAAVHEAVRAALAAFPTRRFEHRRRGAAAERTAVDAGGEVVVDNIDALTDADLAAALRAAAARGGDALVLRGDALEAHPASTERVATLLALWAGAKVEVPPLWEQVSRALPARRAAPRRATSRALRATGRGGCAGRGADARGGAASGRGDAAGRRGRRAARVGAQVGGARRRRAARRGRVRGRVRARRRARDDGSARVRRARRLVASLRRRRRAPGAGRARAVRQRARRARPPRAGRRAGGGRGRAARRRGGGGVSGRARRDAPRRGRVGRRARGARRGGPAERGRGRRRGPRRACGAVRGGA